MLLLRTDNPGSTEGMGGGGALKLTTDKQAATQPRRTSQDETCNRAHPMPHMGHSSAANHLQEKNILISIRGVERERKAFYHFPSLILVSCIDFFFFFFTGSFKMEYVCFALKTFFLLMLLK